MLLLQFLIILFLFQIKYLLLFHLLLNISFFICLYKIHFFSLRKIKRRMIIALVNLFMLIQFIIHLAILIKSIIFKRKFFFFSFFSSFFSFFSFISFSFFLLNSIFYLLLVNNLNQVIVIQLNWFNFIQRYIIYFLFTSKLILLIWKLICRNATSFNNLSERR